MHQRLKRLTQTWSRAVDLSWPIAIQQLLNTLMRSVDIVVTGLFSPAAVAAIGLADLYAQIPFRIGRALGTGAIAISSQDTGRGALDARDSAVTQAIIIGFLVGIPLAVGGYLGGGALIAVLGAESAVVRMGGLYLTIVFAVAPLRILSLVCARALQGTGDTRTPMVVFGVANTLNILGTVTLGLGLLGLPRLGIVGVGIATAISRGFEGVLLLASIATRRSGLGLAITRDPTLTRQLLGISLPNFAEGMSTSVANFPFNALLLVFGTEVNAAYHITRRIYQQVAGPIYRSLGVAASIVVGTELGAGDPSAARRAGLSITALGVLSLTIVGAGIGFGAPSLVKIFTSDAETIGYAITFTRISGITMVLFGLFFPLAGSLQGAGDTRTPFYARFFGTFGFMLGFSFLTSIYLGYGLTGIYAGIILAYVWWAGVVLVGFLRGDWADRAATLMAERLQQPTD